jgi:5'-3' exonuclease
MIYLLIDASYLIFYRYYALIQWWKFANRDIELPHNPYECEEFVAKFNKLMIESIETIKKKLKINKKEVIVYVARDCHRKDIWRNAIYNKYKESRYADDEFMGGNFFKHVYANDNQILKNASHINTVFSFPSLEADDIIAITKNIIRQKYPEAEIIIIASDHDYLQLLDNNTQIITLKYKNLRENPKVFEESEKNLFYKIMMGDKSDCISPVFKRCGVKNVEKYFNDSEQLKIDLEKYDAKDIFERNNTLINFAKIPCELVEQFIDKYKTVYESI